MDQSFLDWMTKRLKANDAVETVAPVRCPYCDRVYNDESHLDSCPMNH